MPLNLPPGTPNNVATNPAPQLVFTPTPGVQASVRLYNPGLTIAYVGGAGVTPSSGLAIYPGNRPVDLQNIGSNVYTCSGNGGAIATTALTAAAVAAGATSFTVAAAVTVGTYLRLGNGTGVEYLLVSAATGGTVVTTATPVLYDHAASATVATVTSAGGPLSVSAGVL